MAGPFCKDCKWFYRAALGDTAFGECEDPTKIIHARHGQDMNGKPEVHEDWGCMNWKQREEPR